MVRSAFWDGFGRKMRLSRGCFVLLGVPQLGRGGSPAAVAVAAACQNHRPGEAAGVRNSAREQMQSVRSVWFGRELIESKRGHCGPCPMWVCPFLGDPPKWWFSFWLLFQTNKGLPQTDRHVPVRSCGLEEWAQAHCGKDPLLGSLNSGLGHIGTIADMLV